MASYTVANGKVGVHQKSLAAGVVDTVTFQLGAANTPGWAAVPKRVEILTDGTADIYVTVDGSTPVVADEGSYRIPAFPGASVITVPASSPPSPVVVKLISDGTPVYSVSRAG